MNIMKYFIVYNGQYMTSRKSVKSAIKEIEKRGYKNSEDNICYIQDEDGNLWSTEGEPVEDYDSIC